MARILKAIVNSYHPIETLCRSRGRCWSPKCNNFPKCNKVLNVITFGPKCNKALNVISLQCNPLTPSVRTLARWSESCVLIGYLSGHDGPTLACSGFPVLIPCKKTYKVRNFWTMFAYTYKKINDPLGFIVLQTQLAFTIGSRNKQAILDSYQSEIFCYTMNPLMIKPREYKLSWPSLYGQDYWILASFFSTFLWTETSSQSIKTQKKKELGQYPAILTSRLVNNAYEYILCRPVQIWQGKTVQKMPFRAQNLSNV